MSEFELDIERYTHTLEDEAEKIVELFNEATPDYSPELDWVSMSHNYDTMDESFVLEAEDYVDGDGLDALRRSGRTVEYVEAHQTEDELYCEIQIPVHGETNPRESHPQ